MNYKHLTERKSGGWSVTVIFHKKEEARDASATIDLFKVGSKNSTLCRWILNGPDGEEAKERIEHALEILCRDEPSLDKENQIRKALNGHETELVRVFVE